MIPLFDEETRSYEEQKVCHICRKEFCTNENDEKKIKNKHKVRDYCHFTGKFRGAAHNICNLRYKVPKEIPVIAHNLSSYETHFITKQIAEKFKDEFHCIGENIEKYITSSVPIKKKQLHTN